MVIIKFVPKFMVHAWRIKQPLRSCFMLILGGSRPRRIIYIYIYSQHLVTKFIFPLETPPIQNPFDNSNIRYLEQFFHSPEGSSYRMLTVYTSPSVSVASRRITLSQKPLRDLCLFMFGASRLKQQFPTRPCLCYEKP